MASLEDQRNQLRLLLTRLQDVGLQDNAHQSNFCTIDTDYLRYIGLTGMKPHLKEVQAILTITTPKQSNDLCRFPGILQHYQDHWARHDHVLAPLTTLIGECGCTKITTSQVNKQVYLVL